MKHHQLNLELAFATLTYKRSFVTEQQAGLGVDSCLESRRWSICCASLNHRVQSCGREFAIRALQCLCSRKQSLEACLILSGRAVRESCAIVETRGDGLRRDNAGREANECGEMHVSEALVYMGSARMRVEVLEGQTRLKR